LVEHGILKPKLKSARIDMSVMRPQCFNGSSPDHWLEASVLLRQEPDEEEDEEEDEGDRKEDDKDEETDDGYSE
jgi:hypothetical protein